MSTGMLHNKKCHLTQLHPTPGCAVSNRGRLDLPASTGATSSGASRISVSSATRQSCARRTCLPRWPRGVMRTWHMSKTLRAFWKCGEKAFSPLRHVDMGFVNEAVKKSRSVTKTVGSEAHVGCAQSEFPRSTVGTEGSTSEERPPR